MAIDRAEPCLRLQSTTSTLVRLVRLQTWLLGTERSQRPDQVRSEVLEAMNSVNWSAEVGFVRVKLQAGPEVLPKRRRAQESA